MRLVFAGLALAALSCGGGTGAPTGTATFTGSIHATAFVPRDAISANVTSPAGRAGVIVLTNATGLCSQLSGGKGPKNTQFLILTALQQQPDHTTAPPGAPGKYDLLNPDKSAFAVFLAVDDTCQDRGPSADAFGTAGAVTFTSVGDHYAGSFDLTLNGTDHGAGAFDAPACPALAKLVVDRNNLACQ